MVDLQAKSIEMWQEEVWKLHAKLRKLEDALKFYASAKNYEQIWHEKRQMWVSDMASDQGKIARKALEGKDD